FYLLDSQPTDLQSLPTRRSSDLGRSASCPPPAPPVQSSRTRDKPRSSSLSPAAHCALASSLWHSLVTSLAKEVFFPLRASAPEKTSASACVSAVSISRTTGVAPAASTSEDCCGLRMTESTTYPAFLSLGAVRRAIFPCPPRI